MKTSIHNVEKVEFSKVRKSFLVETGEIFYVRDINIRSKDETLTVSMFTDSPKKLLQAMANLREEKENENNS